MRADDLLRVLAAERRVLRKMAHWDGALTASMFRCGPDAIDYVALTAGRPVPDADEVVLVERGGLVDPASPEFALPSAARWSATKRVDRALLVTPPEPVRVTLDGAEVRVWQWHLPPARLVVAAGDRTRIEVWAPADGAVVLVPLAPGDTIDLGWRGPDPADLS